MPAPAPPPGAGSLRALAARQVEGTRGERSPRGDGGFRARPRGCLAGVRAARRLAVCEHNIKGRAGRTPLPAVGAHTSVAPLGSECRQPQGTHFVSDRAREQKARGWAAHSPKSSRLMAASRLFQPRSPSGRRKAGSPSGCTSPSSRAGWRQWPRHKASPSTMPSRARPP